MGGLCKRLNVFLGRRWGGMFVYKSVPDSLHATVLTHRSLAVPKCQFVPCRLPGSSVRLSEHANLMSSNTEMKLMLICSLSVQLIIISNHVM